ncbi:MAG: hypothetical protein KF770_09540 [Anaerolineae bacterium]|nr:hypothetical protein [Anaerolineae bacterium]
MKISSTILAIATLLFVLPSCDRAEMQNENLPTGMQSGYWRDNGSPNGFVFFENGWFVSDNGEAVGTYTLIDDNTIQLKWLDQTWQLLTTVDESGEKVLMEWPGGGGTTYDLIIPDSSSNNLAKDLLGTWQTYGDLAFIDDENVSDSWEFKKNGDLIMTDSFDGKSETTSYEFVGEKVVLEIAGETKVMTVFSLGDLVFLADLNNYTDSLDNYTWVFLVRK